ncbi:MAG: hypothetical protein WBQ14_02160 [Gaiellaceae bacterium]
MKGGSWAEVDSTNATAGFKFTQVGKCSKHGLWLRAVVEASDGTAAQSSQSLMKVIGNAGLTPVPGNQNTVKLKAGSRAPIGLWIWGGDVGSKVRYEVQKKGTKSWKLVQTCKRGTTTVVDKQMGVISGYKCEFKVPKTSGVYYVRGHFKATATTVETSTPSNTITVVRR